MRRKSLLIYIISFVVICNFLSFFLEYTGETKDLNHIETEKRFEFNPKTSANLSKSILWEKYDRVYARSIATDSSENIYVGGYCRIDVNPPNDWLNGQILLIKFDKYGNFIRDITFGAPFPDSDRGYDIAIDSEDNIYITGHDGYGTFHNVCIAKYDGAGNQKWSRTWGGIYDDCGYGIGVDSQDNVYITGYTVITGRGKEPFLLKYNNEGNFKWAEIIPCSTGDDWGEDLAIDNSDNIYITGCNSSDNLVVIKYNNESNHIWNKTWGDSLTYSVGHGIALDSNNNLYITGSNGTGGDYDLSLLKYNETGDLQWEESWDDGVTGYVIGQDIAIDSNNFIYVVGFGQFGTPVENTSLLKYNETGHLQWAEVWGGSDDTQGYGICINDLTDNIYITGDTYGISKADIFINKYLEYPQPSVPDGGSISGGGGGGGGGGDSSDAGTIPFGNLYLLFTFIAVISVILNVKRKRILKTID